MIYPKKADKKFFIYPKEAEKEKQEEKLEGTKEIKQKDGILKPNSINYYNKCKWTEHSNKRAETIKW